MHKREKERLMKYLEKIMFIVQEHDQGTGKESDSFNLFYAQTKALSDIEQLCTKALRKQ